MQADSVVYHLVAESRLEVRTGKAGLLGFAGHEHTIRATGFTGSVIYFPHEPLRSRVEIHIPTDGLEVLTPPDTEEIRKVTEAMRGEVLDVNRYPEMTLATREVTLTPDGFHLRAALTMHGQTRELPITVHTTIGPDTLRASATFTANQTDFGITPFRGGPGGTVRVADRVNFEIAVIAVRREGR